MIDNFILVHYLGSEHKYHKGHEPFRGRLFNLCLHQLMKFYPNATYHVITNREFKNRGNVVFHHFPDLPADNRAKFEIFGLLEEPAMFVDDDIIFYRPFREDELPRDTPFNLYSIWSWLDFQSISNVELEVKASYRYNTGIVWVNWPSKELVEEFHYLQNNHFNTPEKTIALGMGFPSSEYATSYYTAVNNIPMRIMPDVNVSSRLPWTKETVQSLHFAGHFKDEMLQYYYRTNLVMS